MPPREECSEKHSTSQEEYGELTEVRVSHGLTTGCWKQSWTATVLALCSLWLNEKKLGLPTQPSGCKTRTNVHFFPGLVSVVCFCFAFRFYNTGLISMLHPVTCKKPCDQTRTNTTKELHNTYNTENATSYIYNLAMETAINPCDLYKSWPSMNEL